MNRNQTTDIFNIIKKPVITDKTTKLLEKNQYCFRVNHRVNKNQIKEAFEFIFNVKVTKVNTYHEPRKKCKVGRFYGYKKHYKKAIITLEKDNRIKLFSDQ